MIFKKYKIRRLLIRLFTGLIVLLLIYFVVSILSGIFTSTSKNTSNLTSKLQREKKYNEPVIGTKKISKNQIDYVVNTIEKYYTYCNEKNYEKAYEMLDEECKSVLYPDIELFKERVNGVFDKLKLYRYKNVANLDDKYVYKISLYDDVMAYGSNSFPIESYYYIIINSKGENKYTISLQGFLERKNLNYRITNDNLQIVVNYKNIYYDHTTINYTITNNTEKTFVINRNDIHLYYVNKKNKEKIYNENILALDNTIIYILPNTKQEIYANFEVPNIYEDYKENRIEYKNIYEMDNTLINDDLTTEMLENSNISKFDMQIPL